MIRRSTQSRVKLKAAIIGGGKACDDLLVLLSDERLNRLNMEIVGVADPDPDAPGITRAREMGIFTTPDFTELYSLPALNMLIELTGSMDVRERMIRTKPLDISSIDHRGARLLWDLIQIESEKQHLQEESQRAIRRERDWCQSVIDSFPDKIMVLNRDRTIHSVNRTYLSARGLSEKEILGRRCYEVTHEARGVCGKEEHQCPFEQVIATGESCSVVHEHLDSNGKVIFEDIAATPILNQEGQIVQVIEGFRDVTHKVHLERELRESEQKLRQFLESAQDIICIKDLQGRYLYLNPAATDSVGIPREEVIGKTDFEIFPQRLAQAMVAHDREMLTHGETLFFYERMHLDEHVHYFHTVRFPILNDQGEITSFAIIARDMTEEVVLQEEVRRNKEYLENILSNTSDMIITTDLEGKIVTFNRGAENMLGYRMEEVLGVHIETLWKAPHERRRLMAEVKAKGAVDNRSAILIAKKGHEVEISLSLAELRESGGRVLGTVGISKDVTEENRLRRQLIRHETELREAHDFMNNIIQNSPNAIIATDSHGNIIRWNPAAEETIGYRAEDVIGKMNIDKVYPEGTARRVMEMMRSPRHGGIGKLKSYPMVYVRQDGEIVEGNLSSAIIYDAEGKEMASVGIFVDLRERLDMERRLRNTQEQLLQSEKLAAMGRLTSQIAHELNNPLYGIMNTLELLKTEISPQSKRRRILEMALSETVRLTELLRKMLSFSKPDEEVRQPADINTILDEILLLHEKQLREHSINIFSSFEKEIGEVYASKNQLRQVFLNMISNAREAMPEGGTLTLTTRVVGDNIQVEISDTGTGIRGENLDKIFDAFFTTKDNVRGVGLGLAVCYGFIRDHGGDIKVKSQVGSGTTFTITLPLHKEAQTSK